MLKNAKKVRNARKQKAYRERKAIEKAQKARKKHINLYDLAERQIDYCI